MTPATRTDSARTIRTMQAAMHGLFVVLLAVGVVRALTVGTPGAGHALLVVALTAAFTATYLSGLVLERRAGGTSDGTQVRTANRDRASQVWITAVVGGWLLLLCVSANFAWLAFALYFLVLHVARRALAVALVTMVVIASVVALQVDPATRGVGATVGPVMGMLVALGISWIYIQLRRENDARSALVRELLAAQDDAMAAQEELATAQREAGVLAERERLARDIHDTLAQGFSSIVLLSRAGLTREPENDLLTQIERTAADGLTQAREVVHALAPTELAGTPLFAALRRLGERLEQQTGITMRTELDGEARTLSPNIEVAFLRIAQSALANVRLHSGATRAALTLTYDPCGVSLEIIDDGIGFTADDVRQAPLGGSGFGLRAIRERVEELGGTFVVESEPGDGAALLVHLPTTGAGLCPDHRNGTAI